MTPDTPAVGVARAGSKNPTLKADFVKDIADFDFGEPPYSLIFPGDMHFMEVEALIAFAGAPAEFQEACQVSSEALAAKYIGSAEKVLKELQQTKACRDGFRGGCGEGSALGMLIIWRTQSIIRLRENLKQA